MGGPGQGNLGGLAAGPSPRDCCLEPPSRNQGGGGGVAGLGQRQVQTLPEPFADRLGGGEGGRLPGVGTLPLGLFFKNK